MEIERGQCFYCSSGKVLKHEKSEACAKLFIHLFGEEKVGCKDVSTSFWSFHFFENEFVDEREIAAFEMVPHMYSKTTAVVKIFG